jgi:malic enzyme
MVKAKTVTDSMFLAAARAVADAVPKEHFAKGKIYPEICDLRKISAVVCGPYHHCLVTNDNLSATACRFKVTLWFWVSKPCL